MNRIRAGVKRVLRPLYRGLVVPIFRPLAVRVRSFLIGPAQAQGQVLQHELLAFLADSQERLNAAQREHLGQTLQEQQDRFVQGLREQWGAFGQALQEQRELVSLSVSQSEARLQASLLARLEVYAQQQREQSEALHGFVRDQREIEEATNRMLLALVKGTHFSTSADERSQTRAGAA